MSEGAGGGSPGGAAPSAAPAGNSAAPAGTQTDTTPQWSEKDDAAFVEMLKRSPHGKFKVDGKEQSISSLEDFQKFKLDAMRSRGTTRLVEESKREAAEAKKAREEASEFAALVKRAQAGDKEARKALRLIPDDEAEAQRQAWEKLPPEVKALYQRNQELEAERQERLRAEEEQQQSEAQRKAEATKSDVMKKARAHALEIFTDIKEDMVDVRLPEVISAMKWLHERKLKIGVDYSTADLKTLVEDRRTRSFDQQLSTLKPQAMLKHAAAALQSLTPEQLQEALGGDLDKLGRLISSAYLTKHRAAKAKPVPPKPVDRREERQAPEPISPFAFRR